MSWSFCRFSSRDLEQGRHDSKKRKDHLSTLFCAMDPISSARLFCQHPALHKLLEWRNPKLSVIIKANPGIKNRQNIFSDGDFLFQKNGEISQFYLVAFVITFLSTKRKIPVSSSIPMHDNPVKVFPNKHGNSSTCWNGWCQCKSW